MHVIDIATYELMLKSYIRRQDADAAWLTLQAMRDADFDVDVKYYEDLINGKIALPEDSDKKEK